MLSNANKYYKCKMLLLHNFVPSVRIQHFHHMHVYLHLVNEYTYNVFHEESIGWFYLGSVARFEIWLGLIISTCTFLEFGCRSLNKIITKINRYSFYPNTELFIRISTDSQGNASDVFMLAMWGHIVSF